MISHMLVYRVHRLNLKHRLLLSVPALSRSVPTLPDAQILLSGYRLGCVYRHFEKFSAFFFSAIGRRTRFLLYSRWAEENTQLCGNGNNGTTGDDRSTNHRSLACGNTKVACSEKPFPLKPEVIFFLFGKRKNPHFINMAHFHVCTGLRHRRILTSVDNVREAAPWSLFCATKGLKELVEVVSNFLSSLSSNRQCLFLTGQSWRILKSWYTGVGPEQGFGCCFADGLNYSFVSSVAQAIFTQILDY